MEKIPAHGTPRNHPAEPAHAPDRPLRSADAALLRDSPADTGQHDRRREELGARQPALPLHGPAANDRLRRLPGPQTDLAPAGVGHSARHDSPFPLGRARLPQPPTRGGGHDNLRPAPRRLRRCAHRLLFRPAYRRAGTPRNGDRPAGRYHPVAPARPDPLRRPSATRSSTPPSAPCSAGSMPRWGSTLSSATTTRASTSRTRWHWTARPISAA